jgi:Domain of unknown function (DUF1825)
MGFSLSLSQSLRQRRKCRFCSCLQGFLTVLVLICFLLFQEGGCAFSPVTTTSSISHYRMQRRRDDYASSSSSIKVLQMAVTPIGPFCPFRSPAANAIEPRMQELTRAGPAFARDLARIQLELQSGQKPDKEMLQRVANGLEDAVDKWQNVMTLMRLSSDFQTREYAKLTQAHLDNANENVENIVAGMKWQSQCMRAMADDAMPPPPPPSLDLPKLMAQSQDPNSTTSPSMAQMSAAEQITSNPFTGNEAAFQEPMVKEEYEKLCRDHNRLVSFGAKYGEFDPLGKLAFLNEVEKIQERWDVFFARFSLMNAIDPVYKKQCDAFLQSMNMTEQSYRELLKKCHDIMRREAEEERNQPFLLQ